MKKAFTLIELLIVIALIVMMVVVAVPQFSKFGKRSELSVKAEEFRLLIENAYRYSSSPELNFNGVAVTLNYTEGTSTVANRAKFNDKDEPWKGQSTESWQEVHIPNNMKIENTINSFPRVVAYFVSPGKYLKKNAKSGIGFRIRYVDSGNSDFVDVKLLPTNTTDTSDQNFKIIVDESWN